MRGFTFIEILISLLIVALLAGIGVSQMSRIRSSRLEDTATKVAALVSDARTAALELGCPTRLVVCQNVNCSGVSTQTVSSQGTAVPKGKYIGSGGVASLYIGIIRQTAPCYAGASSATDGFANWDFFKKPLAIANDTVMSPIYNPLSGVMSYANADGVVGATLTSANVAGSFWINSDLSFQIPVTNGASSTGETVAFQLQYNDCNPATDDSCYGMFVMMAADGKVSTKPCIRGARTNNTDICFNP